MFSLCTISLTLILIQAVSATAMSITVHGGEEETRTVDLANEDRVLIKFTVVGDQSGSTLDFYISYPNDTIKMAFNNVGNVNYDFVCSESGQYILHFSNVASSEEKHVYLDYEIQHYILGMPQMLFLTIVIVIVCVAAVAVFILSSKTH